MPPIRHLFWDFDGTLYESYPQMLSCVMEALEEVGAGDRFTKEEVLRLIKVTIPHGIKICAERAQLDYTQLKRAFDVRHQQQHIFPPCEGMADCLKTLHDAGIKHYLYTHRNVSAIEQLKLDGLWDLFEDAVTGEDPFPRKPAPDALLALMERNGLSVDECAMVGDRDVDIQAGVNAGMRGILYDPDGFYADFPADMQITALMQLPEQLL